MGRKSRPKIDRPAARPPAASPVSVTPAQPPLSGAGNWVIVVLLAVVTFAVYSQVTSHRFLNYDDGQFIYENAHVSQGLTASSITWALTSSEVGWYPLTWLSHELDVALWGVNPGPHLFTNVAIHVVTACLLFFALLLLLRRGIAVSRSGDDSAAIPYVAAFVAALFALHPMHVESVAWASERKDTLSTLFIVLALLLYARAPQKRLGLALAMAASLAAKQMYVTFPFVLLLLDYWPMGRLRSRADLKARVMEKLPLFALSIAGSAIAVIGQHNLKAIQTTESLSFASRLGNAAVAYVLYLGKLFLPVDLALPYPLVAIPFMEVVGAAILLFAFTVLTVTLRKQRPYLAVGWFWFVGTLVPVIGIVAIGAQALADRYTYFSYIGLFLAIATGALTLPVPRKLLAAAGAVAVLVCAAITFNQIGYWRTSETLFSHAIASTPPNAVAEYSLGQALELTKPDASIAHLRRALDLANQASPGQLAPMTEWYPQAYVGLGTALLMTARQEPPGPSRAAIIHDAQSALETALKIDPNSPHARNNLAFAQAMLAQNVNGAPGQPDYASAINRGIAQLKRQDVTGAIAAFQQAVDLQPRSPAARVYLALAFLRAQRGREAAASLRAAKAIDAKQTNAYVTQALRMPPGPDNVDLIIAQASAH